MFLRLTGLSALSALVLLSVAAPADACGRRHASTPQTVYYYHTPCWCPPYPPCPQPAPPAGWDCVKNTTDKVLRVHITSGYGNFEAVLHPGASVGFWFIKDGKPRVLTAFTLDNVLIDQVAFNPIDHITNPKVPCFPIIKSAPITTVKEQERQRAEADASPSVAPAGQPF